jgi:hypothetical protein
MQQLTGGGYLLTCPNWLSQMHLPSVLPSLQCDGCMPQLAGGAYPCVRSPQLAL